jgi:tetratricopeptide (TPR) repeat protein
VSFRTKVLPLPDQELMKVAILTLLAWTALTAADEEKLARALKAQGDFDRVELNAAPRLEDAVLCVQSQASVLPVSSPEELALIHFRKGYCHLVSGALAGNPSEFGEAAAELGKATDAWPARFARNSKARPEPVSSGLRVLAAVARLEARSKTDEEITKAYDELIRATQTAACPASLMPASFCEELLSLGKQWAAWVALLRGNLDEAARLLAPFPAAGWTLWTAGRQAQRAGRWAEAGSRFRASAEVWEARRRDENRPVLERLAPQPDMAEVRTELGGALLLSGDHKGAIASLNAAVREAPDRPRPLYLRARAKELGGQADAALADYNLASRTAFAGARDLESGEAHFYRGILLYRRRDFGHAEDEFSSALNLGILDALRPDASAWRHLAAVAGGGCEASRPQLERAMAGVSPYFPKQEARAAMAACATAVTAGGTRPDLPK